MNRDGPPGSSLITSFGANVLYRNNGDGTFTDVTPESPRRPSTRRWRTSATFLDYDRDGRQDLFVLNYVDFTAEGNKDVLAPTGARDYCRPAVYAPFPRPVAQRGGGRFVDVTETAGIDRAAGRDWAWPWGLRLRRLDRPVRRERQRGQPPVDEPGRWDIQPGLLWARATTQEGQPKAGMGMAAGDYDNDGDDDLLVPNLRA